MAHPYVRAHRHSNAADETVQWYAIPDLSSLRHNTKQTKQHQRPHLMVSIRPACCATLWLPVVLHVDYVISLSATFTLPRQTTAAGNPRVGFDRDVRLQTPHPLSYRKTPNAAPRPSAILKGSFIKRTQLYISLSHFIKVKILLKFLSNFPFPVKMGLACK
jgi:hypothetical protein